MFQRRTIFLFIILQYLIYKIYKKNDTIFLENIWMASTKFDQNINRMWLSYLNKKLKYASISATLYKE